MDEKQRLKGFLIGTLLGCALIAVLLQSRPETKPGPKPLKPWQGPVLYLNDTPKDESGTWNRIRIIMDPGWHRPIRLEETLIQMEHKGSQVISRKAMEAYQAWISPSNTENISSALQYITNHSLTPLTDVHTFPIKVTIPLMKEKTDPLKDLISEENTDYLIIEPVWVKDPTQF